MSESSKQICQLLKQCWAPPGADMPQQPWASEAAAANIRITSETFRLLNQLLTHRERILKSKRLHELSKAVVETDRETLVVGES